MDIDYESDLGGRCGRLPHRSSAPTGLSTAESSWASDAKSDPQQELVLGLSYCISLRLANIIDVGISCLLSVHVYNDVRGSLEEHLPNLWPTRADLFQWIN
jgi:hypothetical protein